MTRFDGLLDGEFQLLFFTIPRRYVLSLSLVVLVKLAMTAALYFSLGIGSEMTFWMDPSKVSPLPQNEILLSENGAFGWVYLFLGWDSAWYVSIASGGYSFSSQSFAFMPGLPALASLLGVFLSSPLPAIALICLLSGVLWITLFESVAEHYMGRREAFLGTLLFALSPFTLLFTTVAYTEGLFLLLTLTAWKLYLDKRYFSASLTSALVALVRIPGFLIVLPMIVGLLSIREKDYRLKGLLIGAPTVFVLLLWAGYMWFSTGDPIALFHNSEWSGMYTLLTYLTGILPSTGIAALFFPVPYLNIHWLLSAAIWGSILLLPFLTWRLYLFDRGLVLYCLAYITGVLVFGAVVSLPRFMAVLFPLWLPIASLLRGRWWTPLLIMASIIICFFLWTGFIGGVFVG